MVNVGLDHPKDIFVTVRPLSALGMTLNPATNQLILNALEQRLQTTSTTLNQVFKISFTTTNLFV